MARRLATTIYKKLVPNVLRLFVIVSVPLSTKTIDEHGIQKTVSIDRATLTPDTEPPTNASQCLPVEEGVPTDLDGIERKAQAEPTKQHANSHYLSAFSA